MRDDLRLASLLEAALKLPTDRVEQLQDELLDAATFEYIVDLESEVGCAKPVAITTDTGQTIKATDLDGGAVDALWTVPEELRDGSTVQFFKPGMVPDDADLIAWFFENFPAKACEVVSREIGG